MSEKLAKNKPKKQAKKTPKKQNKKSTKKSAEPNYRYHTKKILSLIEDFTITDVQYDDGYFIFDMGKNSVVRFHVKECRGWLFGIWWRMEEGCPVYDFFAQYEDSIDKFKPSDSTLKEEDLFYNEKKKDNKWGVDRIQSIMKFIQKHPFRAWYADVMYEPRLWGGIYPKHDRPFFSFCKTKYQKIYNDMRYERMSARFQVLLNEICAEQFEDYQIKDFGEHCSPRYSVKVKLKDTFKYDEAGWYSLDYNDARLSQKLVKKIRKYQDEFLKVQYTPRFFDLSFDMVAVIVKE